MISVHLMTVYDTYETNKQNSCKKLDSTLCECEVILLQNATQSRLLEVFYSSRSPCSLPNWRLSKAYSVPLLGSQERGEEENKTIKDGDIAPWKDFKKEKRKRNQIRPYFEMGRIVKRLHFLRRPFPKISPRFLQDFPKISTRFPQDFPKISQDFTKISTRFL